MSSLTDLLLEPRNDNWRRSQCGKSCVHASLISSVRSSSIPTFYRQPAECWIRPRAFFPIWSSPLNVTKHWKQHTGLTRSLSLFLCNNIDKCSNARYLLTFQPIVLLHSMIGYWHRRDVCLSVCLWRCAPWLSGLVYGDKSCTIVFPAGMFLFVLFDTFALICIV